MLISLGHANRGPHNWLVYKILDRCLLRSASLLRGNLYDLGAGESHYRDFFLQHANSYTAVDWGDSVHDTKVDISADLNQPLPIASRVADTVVCLSTLEHLSEPQVMVNEAFRVLSSGGAIVLQVPWQWRIHEAPHDYYRYTPFGLRYLLGKAGFEDIEIQPQGGFFTMLVLKCNYFSTRLIRGPKLIRSVIGVLLSVFWYLGQILAPIFDRVDGRWSMETCGYFVTAKKP